MAEGWLDLVVAPQPLAVEVGAAVLADGGNALDAALTAAFVQGVTDPQECGIGGFGSLLYWDAATQRHAALQFHSRAGALATPDVWADRALEEYRTGFGFRLEGFENDVGWQAVATPGAVAGFGAAHRRWGSRPWADLLAPAIALAESGFTLSPHLADAWWHNAEFGFAPPTWRLTHTPAAAAIFTTDGATPYRTGDTLVQRDYARSLRRIAEDGADEFYTGQMGQALGRAIRGHGGFVTQDDLAAYQVRERAPVVGVYRGLTIVSDPLPAGGPTLIQMLNALGHFDLASLGHNSPRYIDLVSRVMQWAFADWTTRLGDPEFTADVTDEIMSPAYAAEAAQRIRDGARFAVPRLQPPEPKDTTHINVVDRWGNIVSLTHSLGFSSGVVVDGLGFQLNNAMNCFHPLPGRANSIAPGKARLTGMCPTLVYRDGQPVIAIGAPGGTQIITGVLQVLLNIVDFGMPPVEAVGAPRFDAQSEVIDAQARIPLATLRALETMGHAVCREPYSYGSFGLVHVAQRDPATGMWRGAADPGGDGMALSSQQVTAA
ncbi:MAG: gamma-glutamyltransferase [Anaerolineae bacterium]